MQRFSVLEQWPDMSALNLDPSQLAALKHALTNEVPARGQGSQARRNTQSAQKSEQPRCFGWGISAVQSGYPSP